MREVDGFVFIGQSPDPPNDIFLIGPSIDNEKQISYLVKISGVKINKDRQKYDIKSYILSKLQTHLN